MLKGHFSNPSEQEQQKIPPGFDVFKLRNTLIGDYSLYVSSFINILDPRIKEYVDGQLRDGLLWPEPLIQLNPSFAPGKRIEELIDETVLHPTCAQIFRLKSEENPYGKEMHLHIHQEEAVRVAAGRHNYVLTTGTGSGKSLSYIIPIVDHVLRRGSGKGIQAIIVYPMNALANSQVGELEKFLKLGLSQGRQLVTFERYTGQESDEEKNRIMSHPPDILLTNYVMLELILTRPGERKTLVREAQGLRFLVLDELHTYRGRQGSDVAMLVRRVRDALNPENLQCVGTSATLAGGGSFEVQRAEVAQTATSIFGSTVEPTHVIGETLVRATPEGDLGGDQFLAALRARVIEQMNGEGNKPANDYMAFIHDPLARWIETTFGLAKEMESNRLIRATPISISGSNGAAQTLSQLTGVGLELCKTAIEETLLAGYKATHPTTGFPAFAFRLHQFISRGDTVYASLETQDRYITVHGQQFVPGNREKVLLPLAFCRECGQEYYSVFQGQDKATQNKVFTPRDLYETQDDETFGKAGYLFFSQNNAWPMGLEEQMSRLPDDWLEETVAGFQIRKARRPYMPEPITVGTNGQENSAGIQMHFIATPFRFCLNCGVSYDFRQRTDFSKLAALGSEGRSTATTILALSAVRSLNRESALPQKARKLLSFTDNRQDAALQAGHFNDFIEVSLLRAALYKATAEAGDEGISHEYLAQRVFDALNFPLDLFAADSEVRFHAKQDTEKAFRDVLGYRLYHDLRRGWRVTSPNLEQCGLLEIRYPWLDDICKAEDIWQDMHSALVSASPETRAKISKVLLDYMRRELAIKADYLNSNEQERIRQRSNQRLKQPWAIDEDENLEYAAILFPRSARESDYKGNVYVSSRGGFGQYLRNSAKVAGQGEKLTLEETQQIIEELLKGLRKGGLVEMVQEPEKEGEVPGYQLPASAMVWRAGNGAKAFHDPIRVPRMSDVGGRTNPFFVEFYRTIAGEIRGMQAKEHTAQVPYDDREKREGLFREGKLPVLFCSPTMELGIDIAQLNVVNMRNVPPTPANYAQRSGRAGRSGQPALVFTYCSAGSPHDQYFFRQPERMVAGAVSPPRLDLTNDDLLRAHLHAIWLAETGLSLGNSLKDILDLSGEEPTLDLQTHALEAIQNEGAKKRAKQRAATVMDTLKSELENAPWYREDWLETVFKQVERQFEAAITRWKDLYHAARKQEKLQRSIELAASSSPTDRSRAKILRREAVSQLELLTDAQNIAQSDFYSYRYFASEGFLPGYNFPRLPISAYIPARRVKTGQDEFLSRPRFLAISEFGPRALVYHEGSRYLINRVIMPVSQVEEGQDVLTSRAKLCPVCGFLHPITQGDGLDRCERCNQPLSDSLDSLFKLQNVATKRRDRINSDEEERTRMGFELVTAIRFTEHEGQTLVRTATIQQGEDTLAHLAYGNAATLWRINLGWRRRKPDTPPGFVLDTERGYWAKNDAVDEDVEDPMSARTRRVTPFVEDRRNSLLFEPVGTLDKKVMASLAAALKNAIQLVYQLEDSELATEPLPTRDDRHLLLFYEAAEGGAGVLRRLVDDPLAFAKVARKALEVCHFDPDTGDDLKHAPRATENCEAACYDCLMSYFNQMDHLLLDRHLIKDLLMGYATAGMRTSPVLESRTAHLQGLRSLCQSELEAKWLDLLEQRGYRLPSHAQPLIETCHTRPDFLYEKEQVAVYIDGYHHLFPERRQRDALNTECLEDFGYTVLRFGVVNDWEKLFKENNYVFGTGSG